MNEPIDIPYGLDRDDRVTLQLHCAACGGIGWERWLPVPIHPCSHLVLYTDCEAETEEWCEPTTLRRAYEALREPDDPAFSEAGDLLGREGWLHHHAREVAEIAAELLGEELHVYFVEGEYSDGVIVARAPVHATRVQAHEVERPWW